jgi:hypothetical protein
MSQTGEHDRRIARERSILLRSLRFKYDAYGLSIASSIELPELITRTVDDRRPDVLIEAGLVPARIEDARPSAEGFLIGQNEILIAIDDVGRFLVQQGRRIIVQPLSNAADEHLRLFLYGAAFSALLIQRGLMPLHASAVVIAGRGVAFAGPRGHGKSSLAAAFAARGHAVLSDDKIVARPRPDGLYAFPSATVLSLFPAAARISGQPRTNRISNLKRFGKHCYLVPEMYARTPVRLTHVFFTHWDKDKKSRIDQLASFESFIQLRKNLNLGSMIGPLRLEQEFFRWASAVLNRVQCLSLNRKRDFLHMDEVVERVTEHVANLSD